MYWGQRMTAEDVVVEEEEEEEGCTRTSAAGSPSSSSSSGRRGSSIALSFISSIDIPPLILINDVSPVLKDDGSRDPARPPATPPILLREEAELAI